MYLLIRNVANTLVTQVIINLLMLGPVVKPIYVSFSDSSFFFFWSLLLFFLSYIYCISVINCILFDFSCLLNF